MHNTVTSTLKHKLPSTDHISHQTSRVHAPQQFENDHVVLAEALVGLARTHYVTNETRPVVWPFVLQDLHHMQQDT